MSAESLLSRLAKVRKMGADRGFRPLPSVDYLSECFAMVEETGELFWKFRPESHFKTTHEFKRWNSRYAGRIALVDGGCGYFLVCIDSIRFKAHRVIYAIANRVDPKTLMVDHADGNTRNNNPSNLRLATASENAVNFKGARSDSRHGARGVTWNSGNKKWEVTVFKNGERKFLGLFADKSDAIKASYSARISAFGNFFGSQNDC